MIYAIPFPDIGPEIFTIPLFGAELALRWYAMAYIVGIVIGWRIIVAAVRRPPLWPGGTAPMKPGDVEELLTYAVLGIILGGRLGYTLFYQPEYYLRNPVEILYVWQGGMSFHGGVLGLVVAGLLFCRRFKVPPLSLADSIALAAPPGIMLGRIANFINGELWGRPTDLPWAVVFPGPRAQDCPGIEGLCARHPSQLYEAGLEGLLLGAILLWLAFGRGWLRFPGRIAGVFLAGYALARIFVELFRQADAQYITPDNPLGHVVGLGEAGLSMGQLLSLPLLAAGVLLLLLSRRPA